MTPRKLQAMARRPSVSDVPVLVRYIRLLQKALQKCMNRAGHEEDCASVAGYAQCTCWLGELRREFVSTK